jgi:cation:H+ antiporter
MLVHIGWFVLGTVLLVLASDSLTRGAAGLMLRGGAGGYGVGLASTALGGLVPALAVMVAAALADQPELALGALVGGGIAQLALVLGIAALAASLHSRLRLFVWVKPALIAGIVLLWLLCADAQLGLVDGVILIVAYLVVAMLVVRAARREDEGVRNELAEATGTSMLVWRDTTRLVIGLVILPFAALWMVEGTLGLAPALGVSPIVLGVILLGLGTALASLPHAVQAARRGHGDFALGHALGAALGSVLLLIGILAVWRTPGVAQSLQRVELPALFALAVALYPMMRSDSELSRREGGVLVALYVVFLIGEVWLTAGT